MNKYANSRHRILHLYNPKEEGLGSYDVHYINAYKKYKIQKSKSKKNNLERYVA